MVRGDHKYAFNPPKVHFVADPGVCFSLYVYFTFSSSMQFVLVSVRNIMKESMSDMPQPPPHIVRERSKILAARGAKFGKGRVSYRVYGGAPIRRRGDIDGDVQRWRLFDGGMKPNFCVPAQPARCGTAALYREDLPQKEDGAGRGGACPQVFLHTGPAGQGEQELCVGAVRRLSSTFW
jgi:hypothetical protein